MKSRHHLATVTLLCAGILLPSCASPTGGDPMVHAARGKFESRNTYTQGIVGGAVAGAALGAVAGMLLDRDNRAQGATRGALIGGTGGAVAGGVYANEKVRERQHYARAEDSLDKAIANATSTRKAAAEFNATLEGRLRGARANQKSLNATLADSRSVLNSVDRELSNQRSNLAEAQANNLTPADRNKLSNEINDLQSQKTRLQNNIRKLAPGSPSDTPG